MNILNIEELNVLKVEEKDNNNYRITAEMVSPPSYCPHCGCIANLYGHGGKEQLSMDIPAHGKRVGVHLNRKRYRCRECERTFFEPLKFMDESRAMTTRLVEYVEKQSLKRTFTSLSEEIGVDEKTIRNVFKDYSRRLEKKNIFSTPVWLGIDEAHLLHNYRCVIANVKEKTVVEMLKNRNKPTVIDYLKQLPNKDRVEIVCMDMWPTYRDSAKIALPHAKRVIDKFHVVKMANKALDVIRKEIRKTLTDEQRKTLMHDRYTLLRRQSKLKPFQLLKLQSWTLNIPQLGIAHKLKEDFFDIFDTSEDRYVAMARYQEWKGQIPSSMKPHFEELNTSMKNWEPEIFNYFDLADKRATNAYTETLNGLIKVMNRNGRGYSFDVLRTKVLFSEGVHKVKRLNYKRVNVNQGFLPPLFIDEPECNLGANISTLIQKMLEENNQKVSTRLSE